MSQFNVNLNDNLEKAKYLEEIYYHEQYSFRCFLALWSFYPFLLAASGLLL